MLALLLASCGRGDPPQLVLLLTCDTLRADRLGAYGSPLGLTPALDGLLARSVVFQRAYAPASYTLPSVAALMTGRHPEELGMLGNASRMASDFATLASVLQLEGWRTAAVVSNYVLRRGSGIEQGFELYDDAMLQREANREMPERIAADTSVAALDALDRLLEGSDRALLWVHYQDPHGPYLPPGGWRERYLEAERSAPDGERRLATAADSLGLGVIPAYQYVDGENEAAFYRAGYDGEVAYFDEQAGRLLAALEEQGLLERAIVVFAADHGEALGERDYWFAHGEYLTDPLVRVPLAIRAPGVPASVRSDPAALVDVFPTLLALLGVALPDRYPGRDLLAPGAEAALPEIYLASLRGATIPRFGLVADGHKYLRSEAPEGTREELFALGDETHDLAEERVDLLQSLRARLAGARAALRSAGPERRRALRPEERERLRRLGYVVE